MDVIGMTFAGKEWILLKTMSSVTANLARVQLKKELGIDSLPGLPFDWRTSLAQKKLVLFEDDGKPDKAVGIFVPAERFHEVVM